MSASYKSLFKLLIDKDMSPNDLVKKGVLSRSTLLKIKKGQYVSLEILEGICKELNCTLNDIVEFTYDETEDIK